MHRGFLFFLLCSAVFAATVTAAPSTDGTEMNEHRPTQRFSHADWQSVLDDFVRRDGLVDYRALARDRAALDRYVAAIAKDSPVSSPALFPTREEALAYYINAYNALIFAGVLDRGPEERSVWSGLVSGFNFFVRMKVEVGGEKMSLKALEEQDILKVFKEPRVHAVLNCASIGCPPLSREAFVPERLEEQLQAMTVSWVNDPYHCKVDDGARTVTLNKIFDWFRSDFIDYEKRAGNQEPNLISFVNRFRPESEQIPLDYRVKFSAYDKAINKVP